MAQETRFSGGALRAAQSLCKGIQADLQRVNPALTFMPDINRVASTIEQETKLPELLKAAKHARDNVCVGSTPTERNAWQYLNNAITKAEQA